MIYCDDDAKAEFSKTSQTLQVIISIFEASLFPFGKEAELIAVINDNQCFVGVPHLAKPVMKDLESQINKQFKRRDGIKTCEIQDPIEHGIFRFYATSTNDLSFPH